MISDLKELEKFFKLCRKQGVTEINFESIQVKFGEMPSKAYAQSEASDEIQTDEPSADELIYWATQNAGL